ncbi:MAG: hypothetical protein LKCHEGNO_02347 [Burkholderiaceae bacterium]|nr:hypothetical protein [Burkholderiaceae bacterium]
MATLQDLEQRVRSLEDIERIKRCMRSYVNALVLVQWDDLLACFADDAAVEIGISGLHVGKAALAKLFKHDIGTRHIGKEMIFLAHPVIDVAGDRASGTWLLYHMFTEASHIQTHAWVQGIYHCEYVRAGDDWKISKLTWKQRLGPRSAKLAQQYGVVDE